MLPIQKIQYFVDLALPWRDKKTPLLNLEEELMMKTPLLRKEDEEGLLPSSLFL